MLNERIVVDDDDDDMMMIIMMKMKELGTPCRNCFAATSPRECDSTYEYRSAGPLFIF